VSTEAATRGESLDEAAIHDILSNDRRRLAINCLQEADDGRLSVRDLSEQVATLETDEDPPPRNKRQSAYVSLHQTHLPKLDKLGVVDYDADSKVVTLTERIQEVEVYMEVVPRYGLSWGEFYFGVGLLGMLTTIAVLVGVPGVSAVGPVIVASLFFGLLMLSAAFHVYNQQDRILFQRFLK
jgi:hypothetical protein